MPLAQLNDQTTNLTLKTKPGEPACTTSISGMTPNVEAATIALINSFNDDLATAIGAARGLGATSEQVVPLTDLLDQVAADTAALEDLIANNL